VADPDDALDDTRNGEGMDIQKLMKQAQKMQSAMQEAQEKLGDITVTSTAGGGMVEVTANGKLEVTAIKIKPEVVDPDDVDMLEDMILGAVKEAQKAAKARQEEELGKVTGGMGMPPGLMG
jgi:DNA-binding YbaB/EbfC family protein